jgi:hypothetical protein
MADAGSSQGCPKPVTVAGGRAQQTGNIRAAEKGKCFEKAPKSVDSVEKI